MHTFILWGNSERTINITVMFLDCGRKLDYPVGTHACKGKTCRKTPGQDSRKPEKKSRTKKKKKNICQSVNY